MTTINKFKLITKELEYQYLSLYYDAKHEEKEKFAQEIAKIINELPSGIVMYVNTEKIKEYQNLLKEIKNENT